MASSGIDVTDGAATEVAADHEAFARLVDPYRRELLAHCYLMLGSVDDAEDQVQETYLRAWRGYRQFEGRSSLRNWLYRIATNCCLTALDRRGRRPLPSGLSAPSGSPDLPLIEQAGMEWLQPIPDAMLDMPADPAAITVTRQRVRLALAAALQHLSSRQRAVLILRDVLAWRAAEAAEVLDMTVTAVNSALQHARRRLTDAAIVEDEVTEPTDHGPRDLLDRYVSALENADMNRFLEVLRADAILEMPPHLTWFHGRECIVRFIALKFHGNRVRMVPTSANGQPAAAMYLRAGDGSWHAHAIHVLTVDATAISRIVAFLDSSLFAKFGLAPTWDGTGTPTV